MPYLIFSSTPQIIQSDDASIKRHIVENECGPYSRAAVVNIFAHNAVLNQEQHLVVIAVV